MHYGDDTVPCNQNQGMLRNYSGRHAVRAVTYFLSGDRSRLSDLSLSRLSCSLICSSLRRRAALTRSCSACFTEKTKRWAPPSWCQTKDSCSLVWSSLCFMFHRKDQSEHHRADVKQRTAVLWSGPPCALCFTEKTKVSTTELMSNKGQLFFGLVLPVLYVSQKRPKWAPPSWCQTKDSCSLVWSSLCCVLH